MTRTLLAIALFALLATPLAMAQHGPPPGYTDPLTYAQDYAKQEAAAAQADPVGYAQSKDASEAEHALWLACWTLYDTAGPVADPACSALFTAPVQVEPPAEAVTGEVTAILNDTGTSALAAEVLDAVNDTVADPTGALAQIERIVQAVVDFVKDLIDLVGDVLGLAGLGFAGGLLGALDGVTDLLRLPLDGLSLAASGLTDALQGVSSAGSSVAAAASATLDDVLVGLSAIALGADELAADASTASVSGLRDAGHGVQEAIQGINEGAQSGARAVVHGATDAVQATGQAVARAAHAVQDTVADAAHKFGALFGAKDSQPRADPTTDLEAPRTGTSADGILDRLLGKR